MQDFKSLEIWKDSMEIARLIYQSTRVLPDSEKFGLISQMRRAAVSTPSNIAEGAGRIHSAEFRQFIGVAMGSSNELTSQVILSDMLDYMENSISEELQWRLEKNQRMMRGFIQSITNKSK